jgi:hypothetical protein
VVVTWRWWSQLSMVVEPVDAVEPELVVGPAVAVATTDRTKGTR